MLKRKRWPVRVWLSWRARSVRAAKWLFPAARPVPAQTAAMSLRWFQVRSSSSSTVRARGELRGWGEPECVFAGVGVGDAVCDGAGGAGARDERGALFECLSFGGAFEPAVLVEQLRVELEDLVADDVEAEVAGLDHAGMDRPDRDLVGIVAADRHRPGGEAVARG